MNQNDSFESRWMKVNEHDAKYDHEWTRCIVEDFRGSTVFFYAIDQHIKNSKLEI
jgi:hypothetical protein